MLLSVLALAATHGSRHCVSTVSRRGLLAGAAIAPLARLPRAAASVEESDSTPASGANVIQGVLQTRLSLPDADAATVTIRVVGRNTKGPLATVTVPIDKGFPLPFTIQKAALREGIPDFLWAEEDIYVRVCPPSPRLVAARSCARRATRSAPTCSPEAARCWPSADRRPRP